MSKCNIVGNHMSRLKFICTAFTCTFYFSRAYLEVFSKYKDAEDRVPLRNLRKACNDLDLYPSVSQGKQLLPSTVVLQKNCI